MIRGSSTPFLFYVRTDIQKQCSWTLLASAKSWHHCFRLHQVPQWLPRRDPSAICIASAALLSAEVPNRIAALADQSQRTAQDFVADDARKQPKID